MADDLIGYELKKAQQVLRGAMDEALRPFGLTTPQYSALSSTQAEPGISSATLSRRSFVTPQTMNDIVNWLVNAELLQKEPHPEHKRIVQLRLTRKGEVLLEQAHGAVLGIEERMIAPLSEADRKQLVVYLRLCIEALTSR